MFNHYLAVLAGLIAFSTFAIAQDGAVNKGPGVAVDPAVVRTALNEVIVQLAPGTDQAAFAKQYQLTLTYSYKSDANTFVFTATDKIATAMTAMAGDARVQSSHQNYQTVRDKHFTPDDPLYFSTGGFNGQWHLNNSISRPHVNVVGAWNRDLTGQGVIIGIVDDGVEPGHADMAANFTATHTYDFIADQATQVFNNTDRHGMSVSGVAAARGGNGIGVTGAAPFATVASMKVFTGATVGTDAQFADAVRYHSSGADTSVTIKNHSYGIASPFINNSLETAAYSTSAAAGTVHVVSAGNDRGTIGADSNKKMAQANPDVITVAALGSTGVFSSYSNYGANITVTAPSSNGSVGISTTDRTGNLGYNTNGSSNYANLDYTNNFGGTSSSAPLVAGVMALGKHANPNMDVRLAKHILARTSTIVNASDVTAQSDGGWRTNAAGIRFNQNYGFGLINADTFTTQVTQFAVTPLTIATSGLQDLGIGGVPIPDNNATGISRTVTNSTVGKLEEIQVTMSITHPFRGDLQAFITNPSGTYTSRLFHTSGDSGDNINWTFTTNAFWGEDAAGLWTIRIADVAALDLGTWNSFDVTWRMGDIVPVPEPGLTMVAVVAFGLVVRRVRRKLAPEQPLAA